MKKLLLCLIRFYQKHISPAFPPRCRFTPTCSQYALEAVERWRVEGRRSGAAAVFAVQPLLQGRLF